MAFDLKTARPVTPKSPQKTFDLTTAQPVSPAKDFQAVLQSVARQTPFNALTPQANAARLVSGDPLGFAAGVTQTIPRIPQSILETALPIAGGFAGGRGGLPGVALGTGIGSATARAIGIARKDTGAPVTADGFSQSSRDVVMAGATTAAGTLAFGFGLQAAGRGVSALFGQRGLISSARGRQARLFQLQRDRLAQGYRQQQQQLTAQRDAQIGQARQQLAASLQTLSTQSRERIAALTTEQETVHRTMQQVAEQSVLKVREVFPGVAKATSDTYQGLVDEALKGLGHAEVPAAQLIGALQKRMSADPELFSIALKKLGMSEEVAAVLMKLDPARVEGLGRGVNLTVRNVLDRVQKLRRGISPAARASRRSYTFEEKIADDAADALVEVLEQQGVQGLDVASRFWAQWAPIRNQAFRDFRPFLQTPTETAAGISRLVHVARGRDPGNVKFIEQMEERLGIPLTKELTGLAQRLSVAQKERLAVKVNQELQRGTLQQISHQAVEDAKEFAMTQVGHLGQAEQTAANQLGRQQFVAQQALGRKVGAAKTVLHIGSVVLLYQLLRKGFDAVLKTISPSSSIE